MTKSVGLALLLVSAAVAQNLAGEYSVNVREVGSGLLLRPDGTFEYVFIYGAADYSAQGTWRNEAGAVILNSSGAESAPFRLLKTSAGDQASIRVHVQAPNGGGVQHMDVTVETAAGPVRAKTGGDGLAVLPRRAGTKSLSIHVPVYDVDGGPFEAAADAGEFWFEINPDAIKRVQFRNERLKITKEGLEMTFWKFGKPLLYEKQ